MLDSLFAAVPWMALPVLLIGFLPLVKGADFLVEGASVLAARAKIPPLVIGLTIVAFGTSLPELVVNLFSAASASVSPTGQGMELAMGNILGSNIFNILVILGISALIKPLVVKHSTTWFEIPLVLLAAVVVLLLGSDLWWHPAPLGVTSSPAGGVPGIFQGLNRGDGLILLAFFMIFMAYSINMALGGGDSDLPDIHSWSMVKAGFAVLGGLVGLVIGGKLIVDSAVQLARIAGMEERVIGLTIVAVGTSLPELATSAVAAAKGRSDLALGNVVGSNIFNTFFILGLTAVIQPVPLVAGNHFDLFWNIGASLALCAAVFFIGRRSITRLEGGIMAGSWIVYVAYLLLAPALGLG